MKGLTQDFNKAAEGLAALSDQMRRPSWRSWRDFPVPLADIPRLQLWPWNGTSCHTNNCYNFALNLRDGTFRQPGNFFLSTQPDTVREAVVRERDDLHFSPDLESYAHKIEELAEKDGLIRLGDDFRTSNGGFPAALFFRQAGTDRYFENDYHWFALRRSSAAREMRPKDIFWAHKPSRDPAGVCGYGSERDLTSLFAVAARYNYAYFSGFYEICPDRVGRFPAAAAAPQPTHG